MKNALKTLVLCAGILALAGAADAAYVQVTNNISTSTTWTANNWYDLKNQIYVLPGATLTIEAGTVIGSTPTANGSGALAVCRGAQININGAKDNPVIFTSWNDMATWVGSDLPNGIVGDPSTGTWREACNEWGNLTIMGDAYIAEDATPGNVSYPDPGNVADMEGLVQDPLNPTRTQYGGGNDGDSSGTIKYVSFRYGGRVIGLANELNGLSLGGIGRDTTIHHVEIMNNVDDGIEIWGGTVNLKWISIWNIGDDSFDIDQGWRGKAQFGLIVQGYSVDASQGSGVGDNCFETDGAEDSSWQPVTTTAIYNFTAIGQPTDGDHGTAWRDNARVQYRNCIFQDLGEKLVAFDNVDGDGAHGYGFESTLSWADTWTTDYNAAPAHANDPANWGDFYQAQVDGKLAEIRDSVFYNNNHASAYTEATARGVFNGMDNVQASAAPVKLVSRGPGVWKGGKYMLPVVALDPRPANDAMNSVSGAPAGGFYSTALYRGAFDPGCPNWIYDWSASHAFGLLPREPICFDMKSGGGAVVGYLSIVKKTNGYYATVVRASDRGVFSDDEKLTIANPNPPDFTFKCGPYTFHAWKVGATWNWTAGPYSGTLQPK